MRSFIDEYGDLQDGSQIASTAATQGLQNAAILTLSTLCSNAYGSLFALPVAAAAAGSAGVPPAAFGLVILSAAIEQTATKAAENACTQASQTVAQGLSNTLSTPTGANWQPAQHETWKLFGGDFDVF